MDSDWGTQAGQQLQWTCEWQQTGVNGVDSGIKTKESLFRNCPNMCHQSSPALTTPSLQILLLMHNCDHGLFWTRFTIAESSPELALHSPCQPSLCLLWFLNIQLQSKHVL